MPTKTSDLWEFLFTALLLGGALRVARGVTPSPAEITTTRRWLIDALSPEANS